MEKQPELNGQSNGHVDHANGNGVHMNGHNKGRVSPSDSSSEEPTKRSCLQRVTGVITGALENAFERLGLCVGTYPWRFIIGCLVVSALCGLGILRFFEVTDVDKLWVPKDSQVISDKNWIEDNFPSDARREQIIAVDKNILTLNGIQALMDIYKDVEAASASGVTISDICYKAGSNCIVNSVLELWSYDQSTIDALTQEQLLEDVNQITESPLYGNPINIESYLGMTTRDANGNITEAKAAYMLWITNGSDSVVSRTESWEEKFIDVGKKGHSDLDETYVFAGRTWEDVSGEAIEGDVLLLTIGYFIVIIFVLFVLGKFNLMEQKAWLTLGGFLCIGLSILVSIGLASAFGQGYGPLQSVLPFLLLGIGVDDMFVIMGALNELLPEEQEFDIPHKIADVLRHAGVSITVTSFTDFVAFMIGATTIIPALRSFCIYAGIGILALYFLQAIFFTACLAIDLKRVQENRDACLCCIKHDDNYRKNACSQRQLVPYVFKHGLARIITKLPFKICVIVVALGLFGFNVYGTIKLEQYFDPNWFLPTGSYARDYVEASKDYFPGDGSSGYVYCGNINYWAMKTNMEALDDKMQASKWVSEGSTDSWFTALQTWLSSETDASVTSRLDGDNYPKTEDDFVDLTYTMTTTEARRTANYLKFSNSLNDIVASRFPFRHIKMSDAKTEIEAMDSLRELMDSANVSSCFPYSRSYLTWETNKVIQEELYRNMGLALVCVFIVTLILIANIWTSLLVFVCVMFTLVDVAGFMHLWGLTVGTVTSVVLVLSIGLAVDYSAHIGHMFMTVKGTREERTKETIGEMGPPVFYGGFSTFLAFILLSTSDSYVFSTMFKVTFLVVLFGLFHGLIFLPVILSLIGPSPYPTADRYYHHHHEHHPQQHGKDVEGGEDNLGYTKSNLNPTVFPVNGSHEMKEYQHTEDSNTPPPDYSPPRTPSELPHVHM